MAWAQEAPPVEHRPDESLEDLRTPLDQLVERAIGRTSRRVRYDWRRGAVQAGINGGLPSEFNNFNTLRAGAFVRFPFDDFLLGAEASYVWVYGTDSSEKLALTPYRQAGRPDRVELDFTFTLPLAEGIVTAVPSFFPATQLVFNGLADFRYLIHPGGYSDLTFLEVLKAMVAGSLSDDEVANLEDDRLPGMEIDRGRYGLLLGLGADLYFASGFFLSHRVLVPVPLLAPATDTKLLWGIELDLSLGLAF
ncbi:MAG: hypothetical protein KC620_25760 [Myxococcales bacterium]|nr:hypothetical protein [Myxococcales bacterium]